MEMMNRAIEGASDFRDMMQKLQQPGRVVRGVVEPSFTVPVISKPPKRPGENREQYRARLNAKA